MERSDPVFPSHGLGRGITLRQHIATQAMAGMLSSGYWPKTFDRPEIAAKAWEMADQMLFAERSSREPDEALRKDAERYRWLRRDITSLADIKRMTDIVTNLCEEHMDAAIDAAMEAGNG